MKPPSAPPPQIIQPPPPPEPEKPAPVDPEALVSAKKKIEQEKLRRGRNSLRIDLSNPAVGGGAGVFIPD